MAWMLPDWRHTALARISKKCNLIELLIRSVYQLALILILPLAITANARKLNEFNEALYRL